MWLLSGLYHKGLIWWSAAEMVALLEGSSISTEELWSSFRVTIRFLVTSLTKALLPRLLRLTGQPALGRDHSWWPSMPHKFFGTLPQICVSTQSCLGALRTIRPTSWLGFCSDMYCQLCAFPNHIQSIEFSTGGLKVLETSQEWSMETGCTWAHSKVSEYLCK
jgi:hypothetical protein